MTSSGSGEAENGKSKSCWNMDFNDYIGNTFLNP
jgi:hypothetical protein